MPTQRDAVVEARLSALALRQAGVASRAQLRACGISRERVRAEVAGERWQTVGGRVVVLHSGPLTRLQQWWVGIAHAGAGSALFGPTATEAWGLQRLAGSWTSGWVRRAERPVVHAVVARAANGGHLDHEVVRVVVHESRTFDVERDAHPLRQPRRTRLPRSVLDHACTASTDDEARAVVAAAVQQGRVTPHQLRHELDAHQRRRRVLLRETIDDVEGGAQSLPELEWTRLVRRAGLPRPDRQVKVRRPDGTYYLDCYWAAYGVAVEIDGAQHAELAHREADDLRRLSLSGAGIIVLPVSSYLVRHRPEVVIRLVGQALAARGWVAA